VGEWVSYFSRGMEGKQIPQVILSAHDLYVNGLTNLLPVIPPGAPLAPSSAIPQSAVGKVPGRRGANGVWSGFAWQHFQCELADVEKWSADGANTGLKSDAFPALDIDVSDAGLAQIIEDLAVAKLGAAPVRTGRAPKRLLVYRTDTPFSRMRLWIKRDGTTHLVEVLGRGNQFIAAGVHPGTLKHYEWDRAPKASDLVCITAEKVSAFFDELGSLVNLLYDVETEREGDGRITERTVAANQTSLMAPSIEKLREAVRMTPNTMETRDEWIKYGYAIRAAAGSNEQEAYEIFAEFSERWENGHNSPEVVRQDFRRMRAPFSVGWSLVSELARAHGFKDDDGFTDIEPESVTPGAIALSDGWLAAEIIKKRAGDVRYSDEAGRWFVWSGSMWTPDAVRQADHLINAELEIIADTIARRGATDAEKKKNFGEARMICNDGKSSAVRHRMESCPEIAIRLDSFDADEWALCTPGGLVDLRTGVLGPPNPDALTSKCTSVTPDAAKTPHRWLQFLDEACGGDVALVAFLQRWFGYCLSGSTREQALGFLLGPGGRGKSTYLNTMVGVLKDYAVVSPLDTFTASKNDRHSTDIAGFQGARLVVSSENQTGKRWDEQRVRALTGGERISARLMRSDNHVFKPTFKLFFAANTAPTIRTADDAMKRRLQFIPFHTKPATIDKELDKKLEAEYSAILAWAIQGCLEWREIGLAPPASVVAFTDKYFHSEDSLGTFLRTRTEPGGVTGATDLFSAWRQWANRQNEYAGTAKSFAAAMEMREDVTRKEGPFGTAYEVTLLPVDFSAY